MLNRAKTAPTCKNEKKARTLKRRGRKKARTPITFPQHLIRVMVFPKSDGCPHLFFTFFFYRKVMGVLTFFLLTFFPGSSVDRNVIPPDAGKIVQ
jgi:hypothetical protein